MNIQRMELEELKKMPAFDDMSKYLKIVTAVYRGKMNLFSIIENISRENDGGQLCFVNVFMQDDYRDKINQCNDKFVITLIDSERDKKLKQKRGMNDLKQIDLQRMWINDYPTFEEGKYVYICTLDKMQGKNSNSKQGECVMFKAQIISAYKVSDK